jgi:hypothetical protein
MPRRLPSNRRGSLNLEAHLRIAGSPPRCECVPPVAGEARYREPGTGFYFLKVRNPGC